MLEAVSNATESLNQMKKIEGDKIGQDLNRRIDKIESKIEEISKKIYWTY